MITKEIQIAILKKDYVKLEKKIQEYKEKIQELELIKDYLNNNKNIDLMKINNQVLIQQLESLEQQKKLIDQQKNKDKAKKIAFKWIKRAFF